MLGTSSSACPQAVTTRQCLVTATAYVANKTLTAGTHALQLHTIIMHATRSPVKSRQSGL